MYVTVRVVPHFFPSRDRGGQGHEYHLVIHFSLLL